MRPVPAMIVTLGLSMAGSAHAEMNCHPEGRSIEIYDQGGDGSLAQVASIDAIAEPHFKQFVEIVSSYMREQIGGADKADVKLVFVRTPLIGSAVPVPEGALPAGSDAQASISLDSPWVDLIVAENGGCSTSALFKWSERQLLLDQALLDGADPLAQGNLEPISYDRFAALAKIYSDSEIMPSSPDAQSKARTDLEDEIPPDLLWLFRHAWQSTRGPFAETALGALNNALARGADGYSGIAKALPILRMETQSGRLDYKNILELAGALPLDQYRIETLR